MQDQEDSRIPFMADTQTNAGAQAPVVSNVCPHPEEEEDEDSGYTVEHLSAVVRPVALTMILASLAVGEIREPSQSDSLSGGLSTYLVYNEGSGGASSGGEQFGQALINALVIVGVICAATFVLVLCYYFRCLKVMVVYLIFASVNLLGYSGGFMVFTAINTWKIIADWPTLAFIMYNFAIGGAVSVFWQKGVPRVVTQGYLVCVSVIMSWIVTKLPEWTSWTLLVILALYDLCAVLTPCGPLRALIALAQTRRDPIPGLLYEANVGGSSAGGRGASTAVRDTFVTNTGGGRGEARPNPPTSLAAPKPSTPSAVSSAHRSLSPSNGIVVTSRPGVTTVQVAQAGGEQTRQLSPGGRSVGARTPTNNFVSPVPQPPLSSRSEALRRSTSEERPTAPLSSRAPHTEVGFISETTVAAAAGHANHPHSYHHPMHDADHDLPTTAAQSHDLEAAHAEEEEERSIKLGLGDFVFYSVLVSRAALFDVSTMAACFVSVIMGLGGTLFLLGVMKKALPALPISIFFGVAFYFLTRLVVVPMITEVSLNGVGM